jgi:2-polyprenyl-6-methoxyphenol hydroxylase-like FAD-dependent oxidoreductase
MASVKRSPQEPTQNSHKETSMSTNTSSNASADGKPTGRAVRTALVIGGGIAGPVVATALLKAGIEAVVHEAYPQLDEGIGGSLALAPNGVAALDVIGAGDAVRAISLPIARAVMSVGAKTVALPGLEGVEPLQLIRRGDLHRVLHDRAADAGVVFEYGKRLVDAQEGPDGVTAHFADGTTATAHVLIGADGVRSTVRTLIDADAPSAGYTGLLSFQGYVPGDLLPDLEPGIMTFAFGAQAYYLYWKQADGRVTWGANLPSKQYLSLTEARQTPTEEWLRQLRETYADDTPGELLARNTDPETFAVNGAIHIMPPIPHWHRGRMVLIGDAVHAPSNSTGQGASLAIESGIQLARCLRDLPDATSAFAAYEQVRRERVEKITRRGARTNRTKTPGPIGRKVMQVTMPVFFRLLNFEKSLGWEQRYRIDWDARVEAEAKAAG